MKNPVQMGQRNQPSSRTNDSVSAAWHRGSRSPHRFRWTISCSCVWLVADATKTMALWVLDSHFQLQRSWRNRTGPVTSAISALARGLRGHSTARSVCSAVIVIVLACSAWRKPPVKFSTPRLLANGAGRRFQLCKGHGLHTCATIAAHDPHVS